MARLARVEQFRSDEIAIVHVMNRTVRQCFLMGRDPRSGQCFDHRKGWFEKELRRMAASFGIDLLAYAVMSNHFHLVLRSRPDVVAAWSNLTVAKRWLALCPPRKEQGGETKEVTDNDLQQIVGDAKRLSELRSRLSDISWWMRLLCQRIAQRANREDSEIGKFWQARFRAVRLLDEASLLACAAYVDLNPIRAAMAQTLEASDYTSAQCRIRALIQGTNEQTNRSTTQSTVASIQARPDAHLAPVTIDELRDPTGAHLSQSVFRTSDKGFLSLSESEYLELLDWTAREGRPGKPGSTPDHLPPILKRLGIETSSWCELVQNFGKLFRAVAGRPTVIELRSVGGRRHRVKPRVRELLPS